jgi:hypothetical protein
MIELTQNATLLLHLLTVLMTLVGFLLGSYLERRKWDLIFKAAVAFRKGVTNRSTMRAVETLGRMGFSSADAVKGLQDFARGGILPKRSFPAPPKPPPPRRRETPDMP